MGQLSSVIKALGVEKVIWIDDMFAAVAEPEPVDEIALARSIADENLFDALGVADMGTEPEPVTSLVQAFYDDPDLLEKAKTLVVVRNPADHAKHVMTVMGCEAEARSGADWQGILKSQGLVFQKRYFSWIAIFVEKG